MQKHLFVVLVTVGNVESILDDLFFDHAVTAMEYANGYLTEQVDEIAGGMCSVQFIEDVKDIGTVTYDGQQFCRVRIARLSNGNA